MTTPTLEEIMHGSRAILLDFDGPICSVFSGLPDFAVAARLRAVLAEHQVSTPEAVAKANDPLEVLRYTATVDAPATGHELLASVEREFRAAEVEAVQIAEPTPFALDFIRAALAASKQLAIVSNNSEEAVRAYFVQHDAALIIPVFARPFAQPDLMKPHPFGVDAALTELGATPAEAVLIGDSTTDVEVSLSAGLQCIGLGDSQAKCDALATAGAALVLPAATGMGDLLATLAA